MKIFLPIAALCCAVAAGVPAAAAQQVNETISDVVVDAPPANPPPGSANATSKPKRNKSTQPAPVRRGNGPEVKAFNFNRNFGLERFSRPLIIRTAKSDPKTNAQIQEDLAVMSRILEKTASEYRDEHEEAAGITILTMGGGKAVRSMYLEDYGVVFTLNVNIPLKPETKLEETDEKRPNPQNEEWTEARNELFGDRRGPGRVERMGHREFDEHQFEEFRDGLIESLRNASNIRNLREDDWITVVVRGRGSEIEIDGQLDVVLKGAGRESYTPVPVGSADPLPDSSTLVIRIKKGQVDEFARSKGSPEQFRAKVSLTQY
jgi:hypothetical protein